jgi:ATP-dependent helicase/nuclease subunit A
MESNNIHIDTSLKTLPEASSRPLTPEQERAVRLLGRDLCVSAGAGSGKTGVLVERFVNLVVEEGLSVSEILCITFTDKAAGEMKQRLAQRFQALGLERERQEVEFAYISTIDSFCSRLLRENALEAGLDPEFVILEEYEAGAIQRDLAEALIVQWEQTNPEGYNLLLEKLYCTDLAESAVRLLARIRSSGVNPADIPIKDAVLAEIEDTVKSINLYGEKIENLLSDFSTPPKQRESLEGVLSALKAFEGVSKGGLKYEHVANLPEIKLSAKSAVVKEILKALRGLLERFTALYWEKEALKTKLTLRDFLSQFSHSYQEEKRRRCALDFSDLIEKAIHLLQTFPPLRGELKAKFKHLLVDEFQDTNNLQRTLLGLLKGEGNLFVVGDAQQSIYGFRDADLEVFFEHVRETQERGGELIHLDKNFRSRPEILSFVNQVFKGYWGETGWRPLVTATPFSPKETPTVELLLASGERIEEARRVEARLLANRLQEIVENKELTITGRERPRPITYGDFACLFRSFTNVKLFEATLEELGIPFFVVGGKGLYESREVVDLINFLQLIDNPLDELRLAAVLRSPLVGINDHTLFWLALYRSGTGLAHHARYKEKEENLLFQLDKLNDLSEIDPSQKERLCRFRECLGRFRLLKDRLSVASLIEGILAETDYDSRILTLSEGRQGYANLRKFIELVRDFEKREILGLPQFLRAIRDLRVTETREAEAPTDLERDSVVKILTIHKAKGLEFPAVAVADLGGGRQNRSPAVLFSRRGGLGLQILNPFTRKPEKSSAFNEIAQEIEAKEEGEEERVLYVALTRAQEHLILSGSYTDRTRSEPLRRMAEVLNLSLDSTYPNGELTFGEDRYKLRLTVEREATSARPQSVRLSNKEREDILRGEPLPPDATTRGKTRRPSPPQRATPDLPAQQMAGGPNPIPSPGQANNKDYIYSVTEIMSYHSCPRLYYLRYKLGLPSLESGESPSPYVAEDELEDSPRASPVPKWFKARLGNTAHRALELYCPLQGSTADGLEEAILQALSETLYLNGSGPASPEQVDLLKEWIRNFYSSREGRLVMGSTEVRHEMPFLFNYCGTPIRGKIDLLFSPKGKGYHLLDFKSSSLPGADTDRLRPARQMAGGSYTLQMQLYSLAVKTLFGTLPEQALLFFLPEAKSITVDISAEAMKGLEEWLKTFFTAEEEGPDPTRADVTFPTRKGQARLPSGGQVCGWCEYGKYC